VKRILRHATAVFTLQEVITSKDWAKMRCQIREQFRMRISFCWAVERLSFIGARSSLQEKG